MARFSNGVVGQVDGAVGAVVVSKWRGKGVMKQKATFSRNRRFSLAQLIQQARFAVAHKTLRRFTDLFASTFQDVSGQIGRGLAMKHFLRNAVVGTYPDFSVDYSKMLVAQGSLMNVWGVTAVSDELGKLRFNWTHSNVEVKANATDIVILIAYCPELNLLWYTVAGPQRTAMSAEVDMPFFSGKEVQTWIAVRSETGKLVSDSIYTGAVTIQ